jgi:hypothetical protein
MVDDLIGNLLAGGPADRGDALIPS